jgi:hypothetical protein
MHRSIDQINAQPTNSFFMFVARSFAGRTGPSRSGQVNASSEVTVLVMYPKTIKFLEWWQTKRTWIVGAGVAALVLTLLIAGLAGHIKQTREDNRFVPTPTVNVLLDRKTLKECWAGEVSYETPKDVLQEEAWQ